MGQRVTRQLIERHRIEGRIQPGDEIDKWRTLS